MEPQLKAQNKVTLYLTPWQKRMVRDFIHMKEIERLSRVVILPGLSGCPTSYKVLPEFMKHDDWWIYLTDEQMVQVQDELRLESPVSVINITREGLKSGAVAFV